MDRYENRKASYTYPTVELETKPLMLNHQKTIGV